MKSLKDALIALRGETVVEQFLVDLLTKKERIDLEDRWRIAQLLNGEKLSYLEISKLTKTSTTTVTRVAKSLNEGSGYKFAISELRGSTTYTEQEISDFNISNNYLRASDDVSIYYEIFGNKNGTPMIVLHGGPGAGIEKNVLQLIDLNKYFVILFDQRGCGKSIPSGIFTENNTQNLIEDIYKLRNHLKIDKFVLFGDSWGSMLSILYSQKYPDTVQKLVCSAVFLGRLQDDKWFLQDSGVFFPDWFEEFSEIAQDKKQMVESYYNLICNNSNQEQIKDAACRFYNYGIPSAGLFLKNGDLESKKKIEDISEDYIKNVQIFLTFAKNLYFVKETEWLTQEKMSILKDIPTTIIKARYDFDSPLEQGYTLSKLLPNAKFIIVEGAGHSKFNKENQKVIADVLK